MQCPNYIKLFHIYSGIVTIVKVSRELKWPIAHVNYYQTVHQMSLQQTSK